MNPINPNGPPVIDIWYGRDQAFGQHGQPQRWLNVLGRVRAVVPIASLTYALNGGEPQPLSMGPDQRRLPGRGDFNVEVDVRNLQHGANGMQITATDERGRQTVETVTVQYDPQPCPLPYTIDWQQVDAIHDVAHVVDGQWSITRGGVSPEEIGYDRLIAIGDLRWRDFEVTVPITVHGINASCYDMPSVHAGIGLILRWKGHTFWGRDPWSSGQPRIGPNTYGSIGWYCILHEDGPILNFFDTDFQRPVQVSHKLPLHVPHLFKARVETLADSSSLFSLKVWQMDEPEPAAWTLQTPGTPMALETGSIVLGAHHVACTFGNVQIQAVDQDNS